MTFGILYKYKEDYYMCVDPRPEKGVTEYGLRYVPKNLVPIYIFAVPAGIADVQNMCAPSLTEEELKNHIVYTKEDYEKESK